MKKLALITLLAASSFLATNASAGCIGTNAFSTCYDYNSGNSYNISRFGNSTLMNGYNSRTGSSWTQNSQTFGNTTFISGRAANGNSWNSTITPYSTFGTDTSGNSFSSFNSLINYGW